MKKMQNIYLRAHSPNSKLQKRKRKVTTQIDEHQQSNNNKNIKIEVLVDQKAKKTSVFMNFEQNRPLSIVKACLYQHLKTLKYDTQHIIGFETLEGNFAFDYKFQSGIGILQSNLRLRALYLSNEKGLDKYKICCCLAIGGFSKVFLIRSKINGKFFAAKFIDRNKKQLINENLLENQKQISLKLNSPFLVKTHQFIENDDFYVFVMDYCPGGELFYLLKQIKCMSQEEARICFIQVLLGIQHLHNAGYMYRDLKPQNILIDAQGYMKIADFGLAKPFNKKSFSFCGSVEYMAPQIIKGKGHEKFVDFYCIGALLYQLLVGHPPFYDSRYTVEQTKARILFEEIKFPKILQISNEAKDFIQKLTAKNQRQRLGYFGGCKQIMAHPWIGKIDRKIFQQRRISSPFPVDLNKLNFDPQQIGQSERIFQQRINKVMTLSKNNFKRQKKQKSWSIKTKLEKSHSQKSSFKISKPSRNSNKNKSWLLHSHSQIKQKQSRNSKSPYELIVKSSKSFQKLKTEKSEQKNKNGKKSYGDSIRWTQSQSQAFLNKQNKLLYAVSKLRKKCKNVPFATLLQNSHSPYKKTGSNQKKHFQQRSVQHINPSY